MINSLHKRNIGVLIQWNFDDINVGRNEVANIMYSSASYIIEELHADGIVADRLGNAVYLDLKGINGLLICLAAGKILKLLIL